MKLPRLLIIGLSALAPLALAIPQAASAEARAPAAPRSQSRTQAHPALWVVKDRDTTIYLFGTIHLLKPGISWFEGPVRKAFDSAGDLVLEIAEPADTATQLRLARTGSDPNGPTLTSQLPEAVRPTFAKLIAKEGMPIAAFDQMKPWFAALTLTALPLRRLGFDSDNGVEETLRAAAKAGGKRVSGLETTEMQIGLFDGLPRPLQIELLVETINEQGDLEKTIDEMIGAWTAGDPEKLAVTLNESMDGDPALEKTLLLDRNRRWADWIRNRLKKPGTVFVAVGAGHLAGKGSVQAVLKARHIKATQVPNP